MSKDVESGNFSGEAEVQGDLEQSSTRKGDKQASHEEVVLDERLVKRMQEEVDKRFQSAKDRRWAQLEKQYGELGQLQERAEALFSKPASQWGGALSVMERAARVLEGAGLSDDIEAVALINKKAECEDVGDFLDLMEDLTSLALRRIGKGEGSAATVLQPGGGNAPMQDLRHTYEQRKKKIRPGDVNALMALKREFREKGLEVY